jgi:hypothetical protein
MHALTVYMYWLLMASLQMGQPMLKVELNTELSSWAATCVSCKPNSYTITLNTLCYNDQEFIRYLAYHEACHVFMGHTLERMMDGSLSIGLAEHQANLCMETFMGIELQDIIDQDRAATAWLAAQGESYTCS